MIVLKCRPGKFIHFSMTWKQNFCYAEQNLLKQPSSINQQQKNIKTLFVHKSKQNNMHKTGNN